MPKLYTVKALAELFEKDEETIRCWIREGIFPSAFKVKDGWYVPQGDLKKLMKPQGGDGGDGVDKPPRRGRSSKYSVREW